MNRRLLGLATLLVAASLSMSACSLFGSRTKPAIVITSAAVNGQLNPGDQVQVQSTATDPSGITRIELIVDGVVVRTDTAPTPQTTFTVSQVWQAAAGVHTIAVRAYDVSEVPSDAATMQVAVAGTPAPAAAPSLTAEPAQDATPIQAPSITPTLPPAVTPTAVANSRCTDDAAFVGDITVPDGTGLAPHEPFVKGWRIANIGTCAWGNGYQLTLVAGQVMNEASTTIPVPNTVPGATADLLVAMTAPSTAGTYMNLWRLRNPSGAFFGATLNVTIRVATGAAALPTATTASQCSGAPNIASFSASPSVIIAGQSSTLTWGFVSNAQSAEIDNDIGGVATPGSTTVSPTTTTTYTLTARCGADVRTAQITVTVNPAPAVTATITPSTSAPPTRTPISASPTPAVGAPGAVTRCFIPGDSGEIIRSGDTFTLGAIPQVGYDRENNPHRALFTFDIHDLAGKTIQSANLTLSANATQGNPFSLGPLSIQQVTFTPPVAGIDYSVSGVAILTINSGPVGIYDVRSALQNTVATRATLFQLRFQFATETNGNRAADLLTWNHANDMCLTITYR